MSETVKIVSRWNPETVLFECEAPAGIESGMAMRHALEKAVASGAYLSGAYLRAAYLRGAYLSDANLRDADLRGADLRGAYLRAAYLRDADLRGAYLRAADLRDADLRDADLSGAYLRDADLRDADLSGAYLRAANLRDADLSGAYLSDADLRGADLSGAKGAELAIANTRILPAGDLIGWKKCQSGVLVKLRIPDAAKRSHAFGRKCRAEYVDVIEVIGAETGISNHDGKTSYRAGERVTPDSFSEDWQDECAHGIHFFITREEAEAY